MRDLYSRLGIRAGSEHETIKAAINKCVDQSLRSDATAILLDEEKRSHYDRLYSTLRMIGALRSRLQLLRSPHWRDDTAADFTWGSTEPRSLYSELGWKISKMRGDSGTSSKKHYAERKRIDRGIGAVVIAITIFAIVFLSTRKEPHIVKPIQEDKRTESTNRVSSAKGLEKLNRIVETAPPMKLPVLPKRLQSKKVVPDPQYPIRELPSSGEVRRFTNGDPIAPFEIRTSGNEHYLVKLVDAYDDAEIMTIFVRGGRTVEVDVPEGNYIMKYASGRQWYGYAHLFGDETSYNKANTVFQFGIVGNQIVGKTVILYPVPSGNLRTESIEANEF